MTDRPLPEDIETYEGIGLRSPEIVARSNRRGRVYLRGPEAHLTGSMTNYLPPKSGTTMQQATCKLQQQRETNASNNTAKFC